VLVRAVGRWTRVVLALIIAWALTANPVHASQPVYQTGFDEWLAAERDFVDWQRSGTRFSIRGELVLHPAIAALETDPYAPGTYHGGNFYTGGTYWVGEATGPVTRTPFAFDELIPSWNAVTPAGTWLEMLVRVELDGRWTRWYNMGVWASGSETIRRHSVTPQADADATVEVDTLVLTPGRTSASAYQLRVRLFSVDPESTPRLRALATAISTTPPGNAPPSIGDPTRWNTLLDVPACSQMVYPDGGDVWCSPTSTAMIMAYWDGNTGPCEPVVRAAVASVYDWVYDGHGNWPFNTAYAGANGLRGSVRRFASMDEIEARVAEGVPVAITFGWGQGQLTGAPLNRSPGHLAVVVGFDGQGNPIVNDPAAETNEDVQRTYLRAELESAWLGTSGGTVYLIRPRASSRGPSWDPVLSAMATRGRCGPGRPRPR